ncbi:hypothetical protein SAMN05444149_10113 [Pseudosulfitobacter pseudonitzschiae]|uniref:Uncharacterized protein n=1 Tax=Pseudosulfitobacter pseudonitzschiae TaxID=1402135 RepID=A0A073J8X4_9RHOB|nr:hypothetical protein [Pseudosulfitobacter pseudonitzschiae]KEJ98270.1 hypothetical protein SUH3_04545 [Pseudosulfitobacter pseudonitzschiae]SHE40682.1 hypothetical protein SAMN05444149_10113 [Pseudosulfitobacter pseudonitzschiae]
MSPRAQITVFTSTDARQPLNKRFFVAPDGTLGKTSLAQMVNGVGQVVNLERPADLVNVRNALTAHQAIGLGVPLTPYLPETFNITTKENKQRYPQFYAEHITRTAAHMGAPKTPARVFMLDSDPDAMPPAVADRLGVAGGVRPALRTIWPELARAEAIETASSSAGVRLAGHPIPTANSLHTFGFIPADTNLSELLKDLQRRAWLHGFAWHMVSKSGHLLERSIVDTTVGGMERLIYEAAPTIDPGVERDAPPPVVLSGQPVADLPAPLTDAERTTADALRIADRERMAALAGMVRTHWRVGRRERIKAHGSTKSDAEIDADLDAFDRFSILTDDFVLQLADGTDITVAELLDSGRFADGQYIPCPIEGRDYGSATAHLRLGVDAHIFSFAHGWNRRFTFARHGEAANFTNNVLPAGSGTMDDARAVVADTFHELAASFKPWAEYLIERQMVTEQRAEEAKAIRDKTPSPPMARPMPEPPADALARVVRVATGVGKTYGIENAVHSLAANWQAMSKHAASAQGAAGLWRAPVVVAMPRHELIDATVDRIRAIEAEHPHIEPLKIGVLRGRDHPHPDDPKRYLCGLRPPKGETTDAQIYKTPVSLAIDAGLGVDRAVCAACPLRDGCKYIELRDDARSADVVFMPHQYLRQSANGLFPRGAIAGLIVDEDPTLIAVGSDQPFPLDHLNPDTLDQCDGGQPAFGPDQKRLRDRLAMIHTTLANTPDGRVPAHWIINREQYSELIDALGKRRGEFGKVSDVGDTGKQELIDWKNDKGPYNDAMHVLRYLRKHTSTDAMAQYQTIPALKLNTAAANGKRAVWIGGHTPIHHTWTDAPFAVMSATIDPELFRYAIGKGAQDRLTVTHAMPPLPENTTLRTVTDKSFSRSSLVAPDPMTNLLKPSPLLMDVERYSQHRRKQLGAKRALVVAQKAVTDTGLFDADNDDGLTVMHFNATTGQNEAADATYALIIGRVLPTMDAIEHIVEILTQTAIPQAQRVPLDAHPARYIEGFHARALPNSGPIPTRGVIYHPNTIANRLLILIVRGELMQSIGRLRAHRRPDEKLFIDILTDTPLPLFYDEWGTWQELQPTVRDMLNVRGLDVDKGVRHRRELIRIALGGIFETPEQIKNAEEYETDVRGLETHRQRMARDFGRTYRPRLGIPSCAPDFKAQGGCFVTVGGERVPVTVDAATQDAADAILRPLFGFGGQADGFAPLGDVLDAVVDYLRTQPPEQMIERGTGAGSIAHTIRQAFPDLDATAIVKRLKAEKRLIAGVRVRLGSKMRPTMRPKP